MDSLECAEERHLRYNRIDTWRKVFKKKGYKKCLFCKQRTTLDYDNGLFYEVGHENGCKYENYILIKE